jgi:membrane protein implicated in regulation of membrane protease activity
VSDVLRGVRLRLRVVPGPSEVFYAHLHARSLELMAAYIIWWVLAAVLVGIEVVTGTFYLLAVGIAFVAGGIAAIAGASIPVQMLIGAMLGLIGTLLAHRWRKQQVEMAPQVSLDTGQSVTVLTWKPDGTARVEHRGTQWDAELASPTTPRAKVMYIVGTRGSTLVISDRRP